MSSLLAALDLLDLAIASSDGLASKVHRESAAAIAAAARRRRAYLSGTVVVAITGGTGSGKSSLLNAIARREVVSTSVLRPHTDKAVAWVPADDPAIAALVAEIGVGTVVEHEDAPGLAIIDLPDLDSVDARHRSLVEQIMPLVDAVVWLFDPAKYHDPSIHHEFLAELTAYEAIFLFALNKVDRLDEAEREAVVAHLTGILRLDGFDDPVVIPIAVAPREGEPIGLETLEGSIERHLVSLRADRVKLVQSVLDAGRQLADDAGLWHGTPDDAYDRIRSAANDTDRLAETLAELGIEGPLRASIEAADGQIEEIDHVLLLRSELAAIVAALGVTCAGLSPNEPMEAT